MKVVIDGRVYDPEKQPILVVLDTSDIQSIRETTLPLPMKPLDFFLCPEAPDGVEMEALIEAWKEAIRQYDEKKDT